MPYTEPTEEDLQATIDGLKRLTKEVESDPELAREIIESLHEPIEQEELTQEERYERLMRTGKW